MLVVSASPNAHHASLFLFKWKIFSAFDEPRAQKSGGHMTKLPLEKGYRGTAQKFRAL